MDQQHLEKAVEKEGAGPDIGFLSKEFNESVANLGGWIEQIQDNYDTRHCFWEGQTRDQKKHATKRTDAFPWEGASDLRTFTVDEIVRFYNALFVNALMKANVVAVPVEPNDMPRAKMVSGLMKWLIYSQMPELRREATMLANFINEKGIGAVGIFWEEMTQKRMQPFTLETLAQIDPELANAVQDKSKATDVADMLQTVLPKLPRRKIQRMVTELRNDGQTLVGIPELASARPVIRAFDLSEDLIIPINATDIQNVPYLYKIEWLTRHELEAKVVDDDWDKEFVSEVIKRAPHQTRRNELVYKHDTHSWERTYGVDRVENLYQTVCAYYKESDEDGVPTTYYTVFHPDIEKTSDNRQKVLYAKHGVVDYDPVRYPIVVFTRETLSRQLLESRGIPEIAKGFQQEIKFQRDSRIDRTTLSTVPPRFHPVGRELEAWGPGIDIGVRRPGEYGYVEIPQYDPGSTEIEATIESTMRRYFGLSTEAGSPDEARQIQQDAVNNWLDGWREVFRQVWALYQQYGPEEQYFKIVGATDPGHFQKGDREQYDFYIDFDVLNEDPEKMAAEIEAVGNILTRFDRGSQANWSEFLRWALSTRTPSLVDRFLLPMEDATEKEVEEFKKDMTQIWSGQDIDLKPGVNVDLRMQKLQEYIQGSENIPATDVQQRLQSDKAYSARINKYQKQLEFFKSQYQENPVIGQQGAPQGNM